MKFKIGFESALFFVLLAAAGAPAQAQSPSPPSGVTKLTEPQDDYPEFSPDGQRIVFQSNRSGTWQLWIMNRDGTGLQRLTHNEANDRTPAWSPDGSKILFSRERHASGGSSPGAVKRDIFMMDISRGYDGAEQRSRRLLESPTQDIHPKWANGGRAIIFNRVSAAGEREGAEIMVMDLGGANVRRVPLAAGINTYASLTPDGARLVYRGTTKTTQDGVEVNNSDIFSAAPDGSDRRRLTSDPLFDGWPAISPDGRTIAFASRRSNDRFHIYLMPLDGGTPRQVTFGDYHHTQPAWAPDGSHLAAYRWVSDGAGEIGHIVSIDLNERHSPER